MSLREIRQTPQLQSESSAQALAAKLAGVDLLYGSFSNKTGMSSPT